VPVHPLIFEPIFKHRIWGGRTLETAFGKTLPPREPIGESWELADLPEDKSIVATGPMAGRRLGDIVREWGSDLTGRAPLFEGSFPLLIKLLDAKTDLSVQVHPNEATAERLGVRLKHEAWYVIASTADACIYKGLKPGVTADSFRAAIQDGTCADLLNRIPVKPGQCYYLPSGTVHALGGGILVAEIQTPSDVTYRVFDWNRVDAQTGQPRQLHIDEAMGCINFETATPDDEPRSHVASYWTTVTRLAHCESFTIEKVRMVAGVEQAIPYAEPVVWTVLSGQGQIMYDGDQHTLAFSKGQTVLLPAALDDARVRVDEDTVWLETTVPTPSNLAGIPRPPREAHVGSPSGPIQINVERENR
jgi:mannose-6-phosphate isomerase